MLTRDIVVGQHYFTVDYSGDMGEVPIAVEVRVLNIYMGTPDTVRVKFLDSGENLTICTDTLFKSREEVELVIEGLKSTT